MQYPLPYSSFGLSSVGTGGERQRDIRDATREFRGVAQGTDKSCVGVAPGADKSCVDFREMTLSVDCRYRMADEVVPWTFAGVLAGVLWGVWRGAIVEREARLALSSKRRQQREQSKRRRAQKGKTGKGRSVGGERRRREGDFKIGYSMHQGAVWGLLVGGTAGVARAVWRLATPRSCAPEPECREMAVRKLKADPSRYWAFLGAAAGSLMYVAQIGSQEPLQPGDAEGDHLLFYSIAGGGGAWALSHWFRQ